MGVSWGCGGWNGTGGERGDGVGRKRRGEKVAGGNPGGGRRGGGATHFIEAEIATSEGGGAGGRGVESGGRAALGGHFLARFVLVPFLALFLPCDQGVDFLDRDGFVDLAHVDCALEQGVHVQFAALGPVAQKLENVFEPAHELAEEAVVVDVHFVHEFVEVVFVAGAEVDEGLDGLVRVRGDILPLGALDGAEHVVGEGGEVGHAAVDVGGFVDAHEGFVEDGEEVAEELERYGLGRGQWLYLVGFWEWMMVRFLLLR